MTRFSKRNRIIRLCLFIGFFMLLSPLMAQQTFPIHEGDDIYYNFTMTTSLTEISGLCILKLNDEIVNVSIVNDFGTTLIDYSYQERKSKVKLHYVYSLLNKWYIRRLLKRHLKSIMIAMRNGETIYRDPKHKLTYTFTVNYDIER